MKRLLNATLTPKDMWLAIYSLLADRSELNETLHDDIALQLELDPQKLYFYLGGRAALYQSLKTINHYLNIKKKVLLPAFTCQCVTNAFNAAGFEIVFVDIELESYGFDVTALKKVLIDPDHQNSVLFIQHTFGLVSQSFSEIIDLAKTHGCFIIEDCAHATGGRFRDRLLGTFSDLSFFSSERSKLINTTHGGFVFAQNETLDHYLSIDYKQLEIPDPVYLRKLLVTLIQNYISSKAPLFFSKKMAFKTVVPQMQPAEFNDQITTQYHLRLPAALMMILSNQLKGLGARLKVRQESVKYFEKWALSNGFFTPASHPESTPTWLRYPVLVPKEIKQQVQRDPNLFVDKIGAQAGVWFLSAMHPKPIVIPNCPNGNYAAKHCINLATY